MKDDGMEEELNRYIDGYNGLANSSVFAAKANMLYKLHEAYIDAGFSPDQSIKLIVGLGWKIDE